jgi:hypothetical protein
VTRRAPRWRLSVILLVIALFAVVALGGVLWARRLRPRGPKLINAPTRAREVVPFTTRPDSRFAPLPLEREKHGK